MSSQTMTTQTLPDKRETSRRKRRSTWLHTPQRSRLRRAIFQIHLWVGVVVALYAVVIGVSGSILVFAPELERTLEPHLQLVPPGDGSASLQRVWNTVRTTYPEENILYLVPAEAPNRSASFVLAPKQGKLDRSRLKSVYFNPHTGEILGAQTVIQGPVGWVRNVHYFLMARESGVIVNGVLGICLLLLGLSGVVIWWPGILRWKRSLLILHWSNWKRFNWDLHSIVGFWSCAALLAVSFTGVYLIFPSAVTKLTVTVVGGVRATKSAAIGSAAPSAPVSPTPNAAQLPLDQILSIGQHAMPEKAPLAYLSFPMTPGGAFTAAQYSSDSIPYSRLRSVEIDPSTGKTTHSFDSAQSPLGMRVTQYFTAIHFGWFGGSGGLGLAIKILWVLLGLAPAALGITGLIMYWNRYLKRKLQTWTRSGNSL